METDKTKTDPTAETIAADPATQPSDESSPKGETAVDDMPREVNGPKGPEPTRYGDWEQKGRCSDF